MAIIISRFQEFSLVVASIGGVAVAICVGRRRSGGLWVLLAREEATNTTGLLRRGAHLDVLRGRMAREDVIRAGGFRVVLVATPECLTAGAVGVAVGRRRSETLLTLVMASVEDLEEDRDQEEESVVDRNVSKEHPENRGGSRLPGNRWYPRGDQGRRLTFQ